MEIILAIFIGLGGWSWYDAKQNQIEEEKEIAVVQAVEKAKAEYVEQPKPEYARGKYIAHEGYYISNLSPAPVLAEGCSAPLLTTDLSQPRDGNPISVSSVEVGCK